FLPENPYFYDYLTGRELLVYTAALFGIAGRVAQGKADELIKLVGLDQDAGSRQLRKYSKGMLQRIGIAQALIGDPEVVFMDEPMSGLDPIGRREVRDLLLSLRGQGKTVFFSSHILSDVETLCDRAAILMRGKLFRCGSVPELTGSQQPSIEIVAIGADREALDDLIRSERFPALSLTATPAGVQMVVRHEKDVDEALQLIRKCGGKLVSINPGRTSLEDAFFAAEQR
ncbi:MAG TPA: ABC transporter ATP-binding protein, partial [Blastocatellia bacterium]|nr:ABC transporter ATP-binding protein [Blastocatellia bacterium]